MSFGVSVPCIESKGGTYVYDASYYCLENVPACDTDCSPIFRGYLNSDIIKHVRPFSTLVGGGRKDDVEAQNET